MRNVKCLTIIGLTALMAAVTGVADTASPLAFYDPGAHGDGVIVPPSGVVNVTVRTDDILLTIPSRFYGLNIHPEPAAVAFSNPALLRELAPDSIRIMAVKRTCWFRNQEKTVREDYSLSPLPGIYNWVELDALVREIKAIGAEPYVALGFGAPPWLNSAGGARFNRPLTGDLDTYAKFMADVVKHLNVDRKFSVPWFTIDNEPENVKYPIDDYIHLVKSAQKEIRQVAPDVGIAGPVTGYAVWEQPGGNKLSFASSLEKLKMAGIKYDAIDWHIYASSPEFVFDTVKIVQKVFPKPTKLIISELNLDWRYSGEGGKIAEQNNTGWNSAVWLSEVYDGLQRQGVYMTYYFCWKANALGMINYNGTEIRPAYYVFRLFTGSLGRERCVSESSHPAIGCIATRRDGKAAVMLYNRTTATVKVKLAGIAVPTCRMQVLSMEWYRDNCRPVDGKAPALTALMAPMDGMVTVPARGIVVLQQQ